MARLCFIRHAPPAVQGVCYGQQDVATALSHEEAAQAMAAALPETFEPAVVWSSPLSRCREPASLLASRWKIPHRVDRRLLELSFGAWEGQTWASVEMLPAFRQWGRDWEKVRAPGGESLQDLLARAGRWLDEVRSGPANQLVIAHAGLMRAVEVIFGRATASAAWAQPVPHLTPVRVELL